MVLPENHTFLKCQFCCYFLSSPLTTKFGPASAGRIFKQYHYNLRRLVLYNSPPIEDIQAGATMSEAQSLRHFKSLLSPKYPHLSNWEIETSQYIVGFSESITNCDYLRKFDNRNWLHVEYKPKKQKTKTKTNKQTNKQNSEI